MKIMIWASSRIITARPYYVIDKLKYLCLSNGGTQKLSVDALHWRVNACWTQSELETMVTVSPFGMRGILIVTIRAVSQKQ